MIPSAAGSLVFIALLLCGHLAGDAVMIGLCISLAFGCTAIVTIPALGNSSPLIYTVFALLLIGRTALKRDSLKTAAMVLSQNITALLASFLAVYALASAIIFPRLFAGDVSAFIPIDGVVTETRLAPSGGNFTQTAYLVMGIAAFLVISELLLDRKKIRIMRTGLFAYVIANVLLGLLDIGGKSAGLGDLLLPIRTADYALLSDVEATGFWQIVGGHSEASSYATSCLACVAFTFVYWRRSGSSLALVLTIALLMLLIFSTSSTAYFGLAVLAIFATASVGSPLLTGHIKSRDLLLFPMLLAAFASALSLYIYNQHLYGPFSDLIQTMVFEKASSGSGQERSYWNQVGLQTFVETYGLGIGMGSSRTSSWFISVLSQLGIFGAFLFGSLMVAVFMGAVGIRVSGHAEIHALASGARAMAIGWLAGINVAGGGADPGFIFFLILAVVLGCKHHLSLNLDKRHSGLDGAQADTFLTFGQPPHEATVEPPNRPLKPFV